MKKLFFIIFFWILFLSNGYAFNSGFGFYGSGGGGSVEGTAIKSTGEAGGTKYLREDGDGTSSWQAISSEAGGDVTAVGDCTTGGCFVSGAASGTIQYFWNPGGTYWTAVQGGNVAANRSYRLPIDAPPSAGLTEFLSIDEYGQMIMSTYAEVKTLLSIQGTDISSTGETGGTKYLREDGDGTSSWQALSAPQVITDNAILTVDDADASAGQVAIFTTNGIAGTSTLGIALYSSTAHTSNAIGEFDLDTNGDNSTITQGILGIHDGTQLGLYFPADAYPTGDGQILKYVASSHKLVWSTDSTGAGSSGTITTVKESDSQVGGADIVTLDFGAGFDVAESPDTEVQIIFDPTEITTWDLGGATLEIPNGTSDVALANAGEINLNTTDEQLSFHSAADGEISGEVSLSLIQHKTWSFDPKAVCDGAVDRLFLMTLGDDTPEGIKIVQWKVSFEADPTTEADLDLKYADAFIGVANAVVIDVLDTTTGASSEDTNANINSGNAIANGKVLYLEFGTAYTETTHQIIFEMWYYAEED